MPVAMFSDVREDANTILAEVPSGSALLDAPMAAGCGILGALTERGVTHCPMLCVGDRIVFLVRSEVDFAVRPAPTATNAVRPLTYWPSAGAAADVAGDWMDQAPVWLLPPDCASADLPDTSTILDAIRATTDNASAPAVDGLTWRLAIDHLHAHMTWPDTTCRTCEQGHRCAGADLAVAGLHVALGHANADADYWYWRGLTRLRRTQPATAVA